MKMKIKIGRHPISILKQIGSSNPWVCNSDILKYSWVCNLEILEFLSAQFKDCHILMRISEILESIIQQFVNSSMPISETLQFFESL